MDEELLKKQKELALTITDKCKELGCKGPNDAAELIGAATLMFLDSVAGFLGISSEDALETYVNGLINAK